MAHFLPSSILQGLKHLVLGDSSSQTTGQSHGVYEDGHFHPSPVDVLITRMLLTEGMHLPLPVVDTILDEAEYWVRSCNEIDYTVEQGGPLRVQGKPHYGENKFLLRSFPVGITGMHDRNGLHQDLSYDQNAASTKRLKRECDPQVFHQYARHLTPTLARPARKVVFHMRSKDQGWGPRKGTGAYQGSWTWFEAGWERFDADQTCGPQCVKDARQEAASSTASSLPNCALRTMHPELENITSHEPHRSGDDSNDTPWEDDEKNLRLVHPIGALPRWEIQRNRTANRQFADHKVTWSYMDDVKPDSDDSQALDDAGRGRETGTGEFVRNLKMGDVVTMWAKARFPAWVNVVERVRIDVYWVI